jgi:hypothetical protein
MAPRFLKFCSKSNYWFVSRIGRFTPVESVLGTLVVGGLVGPRAGLADVYKRLKSGAGGN